MEEKMMTQIFHNGKLVRTEGLITLGYFLRYNRLKPGQKLILWDEKNLYTTIYVGDCTPYIQPTDYSGGIGWDWDDEICKRYIAAVHSFDEAWLPS